MLRVSCSTHTCCLTLSSSVCICYTVDMLKFVSEWRISVFRFDWSPESAARLQIINNFMLVKHQRNWEQQWFCRDRKNLNLRQRDTEVRPVSLCLCLPVCLSDMMWFSTLFTGLHQQHVIWTSLTVRSRPETSTWNPVHDSSLSQTETTWRTV